MKTGTCKCCLVNKPLIGAHIIPRAFFFLNGNIGYLISDDPNYRKKRSQKGVYDESILCNDCEQIFSILDNCAKVELIDKWDKLNTFSANGRSLCRYSKEPASIDLMLFFLSLSWRASVSDQDFYKRISLGKNEARFLEILKKRDSEEASKYTVILRGLQKDYGVLDPYESRFLGHLCHTFVFGRFIVTIKTDRHPYSEPVLKDLCVLPGRLLYVIMADDNKNPHLEMMRRIVKSRPNLFKSE